MKIAAVARLKAELSRYLRLVKSGEEILVTERRIPVARLVPVESRDEDEDVRELERQGLLRIGRARLPKGFWKEPGIRDAKASLRKAVGEERDRGR